MGNKRESRVTEYIGDGVYAIFDGFGIWLHANDHEHPTDRVYIDPSVLEAFDRFAVRVGMKRFVT